MDEKAKTTKYGDLQKRVDALDDFLDPSSFVFFDITSEESLSNEQIDQLYDFQYGYGKLENIIRRITYAIP